MTFDLDNLSISRKQAIQMGQSTAEAPSINLSEGAVRSGKTVGANLCYIKEVACDPGGDGEYAIFGRTRETIGRNILAPMMNPRMFGLASQFIRYNAGAPTAQIFGKTVHVIGTSNVLAENVIRGLTLRKSLCDELTLFDEETFNMIVSRHSVANAWIGATTNPDHSKHWVKKNYIDRPDLGHRTFHFDLRDNAENLPPGYIEQLEAQYTGLWRKRFIDGLWVAAEGSIYETWEEDRYVVRHGDIPEIIRLISMGIDYGDTNPTVGILLGIGTDSKLYALDEWRPPRGAPSERTKGLREWLARGTWGPDARQTYAEVPYLFIDPAAGAFKSQLLVDGITNGYNAKNEVTDGILLVSSLLATDQLRISDRCTMLRDELPGYVWDKKKSDKGADQPKKEDDHACDALRYAILSAQPVWRPWIPNLDQVQKAPRIMMEAIVDAVTRG
jgi:PBSX family phage terminase large subunit